MATKKVAETISEYNLNLTDKLPEKLSGYNFTVNILVAVAVVVITTLVFIYVYFLKRRTKPPADVQQGRDVKPRFRKRDKVLFYGTKMLRKVRTFTKDKLKVDEKVGGPRKMKKRQIALSIARRLLHLRRESKSSVILKRELPSAFFETDILTQKEGDAIIPPEFLNVLRSVRVFGHFEKPLFLELCKQLDTRSVLMGEYLFKVGEPDNSIFVVQTGKVEVFVNESDGRETCLKIVEEGESIHSLLSLLDVLTGHPAPYKTVNAKALVDSTVLRIPVAAFSTAFDKFPESLVRIVQVIMVRLQRVTFLALHNYLGLTQELMNSKSQMDQNLSIHSITPIRREHESSPRAGPGKRRNRGSDRDDTDTAMSDFDDTHTSSGNTDQQGPRKGSKVKFSNIQLSVSDEEILAMATNDIAQLLGLKDKSMLEKKLILRKLPPHFDVVKQGEQESLLLFVVTGSLNVMQQEVGGDKMATLFIAHPGDFVGTMAVLTGEPSFFTIRVRGESRVVTLDKNHFYDMIRVQPSVVLNAAHCTVQRLSPFVRQIDFALDWMHLEAGHPLYRQGDQSDAIYILLNGRIRMVADSQSPMSKKTLVGEYGRGEVVGILEVITRTKRAMSGLAVRDTELAKIPDDLLNHIKRRYPQVVTRLVHLLSHRLLHNAQNKDTPLRLMSENQEPDLRSTVSNLAAVAVIPASEDIHLAPFTMELRRSLQPIGSTLRLTSDVIQDRLGAAALDSKNEYRLLSWLGQQEDIHRMVIYQCDQTLTAWTKRCIRQSDCILIVAKAENDPSVGKLESQLEDIAARVQKVLVLLHKQDGDKPSGTAEWLNARGWVTSHLHVRCPKRIFSKKSDDKLADMYKLLNKEVVDNFSDFSRLARMLTGTSIGLVLGGGGARGISQLGFLKVMQDVGIPVDMIGGTSIGSFVGALWAEERDPQRVSDRARRFSVEMMSLWSKVIDLTYPYTSMFSGAFFNRIIHGVIGDIQIEDLWIPYFAISTDITSSKMRVHTSGSLWRYVRASMTIVVVLPPICDPIDGHYLVDGAYVNIVPGSLWRYARSSMSLAGYMPPLCDPVDGHLLLDGGYVNNLPADVMRAHGAQTVFAVDVGSQDEINLTNYGDELSGWWLLWKRWNPWASPVKVPDMNEIQSRLAYVSCVRLMEAIQKNEMCEYIRPPIDKFGTLQFNLFDDIYDVGLHHAKAYFSTYHKEERVKELLQEKQDKRGVKKFEQQQQLMPANCSFTDLAELVCTIQKPGYSDDDGDDEYESDDSLPPLDEEHSS